MADLAHDLQHIIEAAEPRLRRLSEDQVSARPAPDRWPAKAVLGHLIDSAANNHRRFVEAQLTDDLVFPGYDQEQWVALQHYEAAQWPELVTLWAAYNRHLAHLVAAIPNDQLTRPRHPHTLDPIAWRTVNADVPVTLGYFIQDYIDHLQEHLRQIEASVGTNSP